MTPERITLLETMEGWEWEAADPWEPNRLNWIAQFKKFGKIPSHATINADEKRAGDWQNKQRNDYKQKKEGMTPERIAILEATEGWQWEYEDQWEPNHINWITQYNKLGSKPIATSAHADEKRAGIWQSRQRVLYKENSPLISADRIALLEATKGWTWGIDDEWETHRLEWIYQLKKLGKAPSDTDKNADEKRAGQWQGKQRQDYKKKEARMTAARIAALESIDGWEWEVKDTWESSRLAWAALYQKLGKNPSGGASDINEKQAHKWQTHQRDDYKKKEPCMTAERIKALEATVGWKWAEEDPWDSNQLLWIAFYQTVGRTPSGMSKNTEEKFLGQWQQFQRQLYKKKDHRMTADRIKILEATEGWSWTGSRSLPKVTECDVIEHVNDEDEVEGLERKRHIPTGEGTGAPQDRTRSQLEILHKEYKTRNADTYFSLMQTDPAKFEEYHAVADVHDARDPPERKPQHRVAEMLKKNNRASYKAIDLGCGRNALRSDERVSKMAWTSVDVIAADPTVTVADMGALPFEDESFDIAVLNRSLWARNHDAVLREVYRILKEGGRAIFCESFQRWYLAEKKENELLTAVKAAGFTVISEEGTTSDSSVSVFQYIEVRRN
jgi:hypothetical protein